MRAGPDQHWKDDFGWSTLRRHGSMMVSDNTIATVGIPRKIEPSTTGLLSGTVHNF